MKKETKLNTHKKDIVGLAYDLYDPKLYYYGINTYIVYKKNDYYEFEKYKKYEYNYKDQVVFMLDKLERNDYIHISYWIKKNYEHNIELEKEKRK